MRIARRAAFAGLLGLPAAAMAQRRDGSGKPAALSPKLPATPPPPKLATTYPQAASQTFTNRADLAPVPNRALEGPVVIAPPDAPSFGPSVIQRRLPGRGAAAEGSPSRTEERLFEPAPGARLTLPFTY